MQILDADAVVDIYVHWNAGHTIADVARRLGLDRKTVRKYVRTAERRGCRGGAQPTSRAEWARLVAEWFPLVGDVRLRQPTWHEIAPHHGRIASMIRTTPVSRIHRRLCDEHGLTASLASFRRYVRANFGEATGEAD